MWSSAECLLLQLWWKHRFTQTSRFDPAVPHKNMDRLNPVTSQLQDRSDEVYARYESNMGDMDECFLEEHSADLSYSDLDTFPQCLTDKSEDLMSLQIDHNQITILPRTIGSFGNLVSLDISNNGMTYLSEELVNLQHLRTLTARNNHFDSDSIPKELGRMLSLQVVNFSGNHFTEFPMQFTQLEQLKCMYLGANNIQFIPREIRNLQRLEVLYIGGNKLGELPVELGLLLNLTSLILCDNNLESLPSSLSNLRRLRSLSLHNNNLSTLPPEIVKLNLVELSLRNNPLVVRFVQEMSNEPPTLRELAGRVIKVKNIKYTEEDLPRHLIEYLLSAHSCVNPQCRGVYFTSRVEHVQFVDFCGKYRLPLLDYLCSSQCSTHPMVAYSSESESEDEVPVVVSKMKKVLLG